MKTGWEIKKLGEVCKLYQPKTISVEMFVEDGEYFVYGANGIIGHYNQYNHEDSEVLLTCRGATCGSVNISEPYSWINGNAMVVKPLDKNNIKQQFLKYYLISVDWNDIITGAAQPQITRLSLSPLPIPVPPLPEQERIVSELDLISGVIEKKKQQLKELDSLAQSIFYEMFGNPVENEKGWEVKKLGEVCDIICGQDYKSVKDDNGKYPIYGTGGIMGYASQYRCPANSIIIGRKGNINNPLFVNCEFWNVDTAFGVVPNTTILTPIYFFFFCKNYDFTRHDVSVTIPSLRRVDILKIDVAIPPLSLQQEFASMIESIERQKELIKQSLQETETLFNSRMDFYFN